LSTSTAEFIEDLNRIKYIRKLITRYETSKDLKERLILNHIIVLSNVFPGEICAKILYFKLKDQYKYIKPFLLLLGILPDKLFNISDENVVDIDMIEIDSEIVNALRKI